MSFVGWINNEKQNIVPECLAMNPNPKLVNYLKRNPAMIDWKVLSANPNAIDLFVKMTSFLMTTQMGTQISFFLKSSRKYKPKYNKKSVSFNFFVILATFRSK